MFWQLADAARRLAVFLLAGRVVVLVIEQVVRFLLRKLLGYLLKLVNRTKYQTSILFQVAKPSIASANQCKKRVSSQAEF